MTPLAQHAQTVMLSDDELEAIREGRSGYATPQKDTYEEEEDDDEEEYDDEYDDDEEDDEDGEVSFQTGKSYDYRRIYYRCDHYLYSDFLYCTGSRSGKYRWNCKKR